MSENIHAEEIELLRKVLSDNYHDIEFFKEGGTRRLYQAKWGPADEEVVIKVDRERLESPRAKRHVERGCDTRNDVLALAKIRKIENPESHNINRLMDFKTLEDGKVISIESKFDNAPNLEELVGEKGPLKVKDFEKVFSQVLEAEGYLIHIVGLYHRDNKPSNILVGENLEVRLTDLANACRKDHPEIKAFPTAGGHFIWDPLLADDKYKEQTELFAIGVDMYYALTGKYIFEYDQDKGTAVDFKGRSLHDENGKPDKAKHEQALEEALAELKNGAGKYAKIIRRLLTSDEDKRYKSIDKLVMDFERAKHPLITKKRAGIGLLAGAVLTAVMTALYGFGGRFIESRYQEIVKQAKGEAGKYPVSVQWTEDQEIVNNLINLDFAVWTEKPWNCVYGDNDKPPFLSFKQGQEIQIAPKPKETPKGDCKYAFPYFNGKVFIEGWEGKEFKTDIVGVNTNVYEEWFPYTPQIKFTIPKDMPDGNYKLCMVIYAPEGPHKLNETNAISDVKFNHPGKCLVMKTIPIVVGDIDEKIHIDTMSFNWGYRGQYFGVSRIEKLLPYKEGMPLLPDIDNNLVYELFVPELGWSRENKDGSDIRSSSFGRELDLPDPTDTLERTLVITARQDGKPMLFAAYPFKGEKIAENYYRWVLAIPGKDFPEKIEEYREKFFSHDQPR
jgi:hypothetical protein